MELLEFNYPSATRRVTRKAHVGVVGSGRHGGSDGTRGKRRSPCLDPNQRKRICSYLEGRAGPLLRPVRRRGSLYINDAGATPGSVMLRLEQAAEVIEA